MILTMLCVQSLPLIRQPFFTDIGNGVMGEALTLGLSNKIRQKFNLPAIDVHNLGIVPVSFLPNLPQKNFFGTTVGE